MVESFLNKIRHSTVRAWTRYGILPSIIAAQAVLESDFGTSKPYLEGNNIFWAIDADGEQDSDTVGVMVLDEADDTPVYFYKYDNVDLAINSYLQVLSSDVVNYEYLHKEGRVEEAVFFLHPCHEFDSDGYSEQLLSIIDEYDLKDWDTEGLALEFEGETDGLGAVGDLVGAFGFSFVVKNDKDWDSNKTYIYNGYTNEIFKCDNNNELNAFKTLWKANHNTDLKHYTWDSNKDKTYQKLFALFNSQPPDGRSYTADIAFALKELKALVAYQASLNNDPTSFRFEVVMAVRANSQVHSEIVGYVTVGETYKLLETQTVCDYHWGKIKFKGVDRWVAIGHIDGTVFGQGYRDGRLVMY